MIEDEVAGQLQDYVRRLERQSYGWLAAHLHLSKLRARNRRDFQLRIAANEFAPLLRRLKGDLFQLASGDIVYVWRSDTRDEVQEVVRRLHYLFSDDPLVGTPATEEATAEVDGGGADEFSDERTAGTRFCTWYDLERQFYDFLDAVDRLGESTDLGQQGRAHDPGRPLDPAALVRAEHALSTMDVSDLIRRQPVCALIGDQPPMPVFHEAHLAVGELAKRLTPGSDLTAEPWLFQRLAESFDRRMLAALADDLPDDQALSINLRLATLLSPAFLAFDERLREKSRREMIIELQLVDIFAELGAYMFIRDYLRKRNYRILIDGLHHLHLPLINRKRLGADLMKVVWSPDLLDEPGEGSSEALSHAVRTSGVDRVILCRCDTSRAVTFGQGLGLRLFQGHYLDSRMRAQRAPAIGAARQAMRARAN